VTQAVIRGGKPVDFVYVIGKPNEDVISETKQAIENTYPAKEGKTFIALKNVIYEIKENPFKYPLVSSIPTDQYRKTILSKVIRKDLKWELYTSNKGAGKRNGAVFIRGDME
jgi:hypothetical protein